MSNNSLGLFMIVMGIFGFLIKNMAIERRISIYKLFGKIKDDKDIEKTTKYLNTIFTVTLILIIILGINELLR